MASGHIRKREYKSGVSWQIVIENGVDANGNRIRIYKTVKGTKKEAQKVMTEMLNEIDKGTYIQPNKKTLKEFLEEWIQTFVEPTLSPTTVVGYKSNINGHIIPNLGHIPIQNLNSIQIQKFYNQLANENYKDTGKPLSTRTIQHIHTNLKSALKQAAKIGIIEKNPAEHVIIPKVKKYNAEVYDEDEVRKLLQFIKNTRLEVPVTLAVGLGLRRGEVFGLKWSSIDFDKKELIVESSLAYAEGKLIFKDPKSEAGYRRLKLSESIILMLRAHRLKQKENKLMLGLGYNDKDLVCCKEDGNPIIPGTFSHTFSDFLKDHGFKPIRFHDLRHTHASLLLKYGVSAKVASTRLGHSSIGITLDLYSHVYSDAEVEATNKIEAGIFEKKAL